MKLVKIAVVIVLPIILTTGYAQQQPREYNFDSDALAGCGKSRSERLVL